MNRRKFFSSLIPACLLPTTALATEPEPSYKIKLQVAGSVAELTIEGSKLDGRELDAVESMIRRARRQIRDQAFTIADVEVTGKEDAKETMLKIMTQDIRNGGPIHRFIKSTQ